MDVTVAMCSKYDISEIVTRHYSVWLKPALNYLYVAISKMEQNSQLVFIRLDIIVMGTIEGAPQLPYCVLAT